MTFGRTFLKTLGLLTPFMLMQPALAQQDWGNDRQQQGPEQQAEQMKGKKVVDIDGKTVGKVSDVVTEDGQTHVVIKAEGLDKDEITLPATRIFRSSGEELQVAQNRSQLEETGDSPR